MTHTETRWLPPSPHREWVERAIANGVAHIVERGHNIAPLLVFEDGGAIELPRVRYQMTRAGMAMVADSAPAAEGVTRFTDVCGSVDEIKGRVAEAEGAADLAADDLGALVEDIRYMLGRMSRRGDQYHAFLLGVRAAVDEMLARPRPDGAASEARLGELAESLGAGDGALTTEGREAIYAAGEAVREAAGALEAYLGAGRETAMGIARLYAEIRGGRNWRGPEIPPDPAR